MTSRVTVALDGPRPPSYNMHADRLLLEEAPRLGAAVRVYTWQPPAVSLGRSQPQGDVNLGLAEALGYRVVRRPSGGRAIVHEPEDVTFAIASRPGELLPGDPVEAALEAARLVARALRRLGVPAEPRGRVEYRPRGPICVLAEGSGDVLVGGRKIGASAAVARRTGVLVHGILLNALDPVRWVSLIRTPDPGGDYRLLREKVAGLADVARPVASRSLARALAEVLQEEGYSAWLAEGILPG